jgi:uncharacterized protein (TIGR00730 family)
MKRITVFGGSRTSPGELDYEQAHQLGQMLGKQGFSVITGGYIGTMEAVSRGASEQGGHVIGVTCDEIETWRPVKPNRWIDEEMRFATLRQRMYTMIDSCDAALALPGGAGTLTEISVMWNHLLTEAITPRPLILIGPGWTQTFEMFYHTQSNYIPEDQRCWLSFAPDVQAAFQLLKEKGLVQ